LEECRKRGVALEDVVCNFFNMKIF
jgi:hypothetical protein